MISQPGSIVKVIFTAALKCYCSSWATQQITLCYISMLGFNFLSSGSCLICMCTHTGYHAALAHYPASYMYLVS